MKKTMTILFMILGLISYSQNNKKTISNKDSVYIVKQVDDMNDKTYYFPSKALVCIDEVKAQGISLSSFIDAKDGVISVSDLKMKMVGIGNCVENNTFIVKFSDESKIELKSWNDFNCEGDAWFSVKEDNLKSLETKKITKIRVQNGRTFESFTMEVPEIDSDYFIQLIYATKNNKIKTLKK
jgi:hypothetical protein